MKTYLKPDIFVKKIESREDDRITVLMITESNMAQKPNKLGKRSFLIRGTKDNDTKIKNFLKKRVLVDELLLQEL